MLPHLFFEKTHEKECFTLSPVKGRLFIGDNPLSRLSATAPLAKGRLFYRFGFLDFARNDINSLMQVVQGERVAPAGRVLNLSRGLRNERDEQLSAHRFCT